MYFAKDPHSSDDKNVILTPFQFQSFNHTFQNEPTFVSAICQMIIGKLLSLRTRFLILFTGKVMQGF